MKRREDYERSSLPRPVPANVITRNETAASAKMWHGEVVRNGQKLPAIGITVGTKDGREVELVAASMEDADDLIRNLIASRNACWPHA